MAYVRGPQGIIVALAQRIDGPRAGSSFLAPETRDGRGLFHPRRDLTFVEVVD